MFLAEMDGIYDSHVFVLIATNRPKDIDPAILREGRIDRHIRIGRPTSANIGQYLKIHMKNRPLAKDVSFADLKQTLLYFAKEMFGEETKIRLRPSFFPFTEISAEMDISCPFCKGNGCNICKGAGWVEILGCGMVDPAVLNNCKIDSKQYSGFAFGMGVERITMLKYQVKDLRLFFENDIRFLKQFKTVV